MSTEKPGFITFTSFYLFFCAAICLFIGLLGGLTLFIRFFLDPTHLTTTGLSIQNLLLSIIKLIFFGFIFWKTAMGLLNKKKWARLITILMFGYSFFGYILELILGKEDSFLFFQLLLTGTILYGMTLNQSVNDYFN